MLGVAAQLQILMGWSPDLRAYGLGTFSSAVWRCHSGETSGEFLKGHKKFESLCMSSGVFLDNHTV